MNLDFNSLMQQAAGANQDVSQQTANLPQVEDQLRQQIFGGNDPTQQSLESNSNNDIQQLYNHDKLMSQIYAPPAQGQQATPTTGPGVAQTVAGATGLNGIVPGITMNPFGAIQFNNTQDKNYLGDATQNYQMIQDRAAAKGNALDTLIEGAKTKIAAGKLNFDDLQQLIDDQIKKENADKTSSTLTTAELKEQALESLEADLQGKGGKMTGMTLEDALANYSGVYGLTPQDIYDKYNQVNNPTNKLGYGPAKQTPPQLDAYGIKPSAAVLKRYNDEISAVKGLQTLSNTSQDILDNASKLNPLEKLGMYIPGIAGGETHVDPTVAKISSEAYGLLNSLRTTAIGGRITQNEINWLLNNRVPSAKDTLPVALAKVAQLKQELDQKIANPDYIMGGAAGAFNINKQGSLGKIQQTGTIRVKELSTGRTGTLPAGEFDPTKYQKL